MAEEKGAWDVLAEQALECLIATRNIAQMLRDIDPELENEEDEPDFTELNRLVSARQAAVDALKAVDTSVLEQEPVSEHDRMNRGIVQDLFSQIAVLDEESSGIMEGLGKKYREKLKHIRQSRETLESYGKQQIYDQGLMPEMTAGLRFNEAN